MISGASEEEDEWDNASTLLDLTGHTSITKLTSDGERWGLFQEAVPSITYDLGDWWPIFAFRRLTGWINDIPTTYTNLDLTEPLTLCKKLGWRLFVGNAPSGAVEDDVPINKCLHSCAHRHCEMTESYVVFSKQTLRGYKIYDTRWMTMISALQSRLKNLEVTIPDA